MYNNLASPIKLKVAVALSVCKSKPEDTTLKSYVEYLQKNIKEGDASTKPKVYFDKLSHWKKQYNQKEKQLSEAQKHLELARTKTKLIEHKASVAEQNLKVSRERVSKLARDGTTTATHITRLAMERQASIARAAELESILNDVQAQFRVLQREREEAEGRIKALEEQLAQKEETLAALRQQLHRNEQTALSPLTEKQTPGSNTSRKRKRILEPEELTTDGISSSLSKDRQLILPLCKDEDEANVEAKLKSIEFWLPREEREYFRKTCSLLTLPVTQVLLHFYELQRLKSQEPLDCKLFLEAVVTVCSDIEHLANNIKRPVPPSDMPPRRKRARHLEPRYDSPRDLKKEVNENRQRTVLIHKLCMQTLRIARTFLTNGNQSHQKQFLEAFGRVFQRLLKRITVLGEYLPLQSSSLKMANCSRTRSGYDFHDIYAWLDSLTVTFAKSVASLDFQKTFDKRLYASILKLVFGYVTANLAPQKNVFTKYSEIQKDSSINGGQDLYKIAWLLERVLAVQIAYEQTQATTTDKNPFTRPAQGSNLIADIMKKARLNIKRLCLVGGRKIKKNDSWEVQGTCENNQGTAEEKKQPDELEDTSTAQSPLVWFRKRVWQILDLHKMSQRC